MSCSSVLTCEHAQGQWRHFAMDQVSIPLLQTFIIMSHPSALSNECSQNQWSQFVMEQAGSSVTKCNCCPHAWSCAQVPAFCTLHLYAPMCVEWKQSCLAMEQALDCSSSCSQFSRETFCDEASHFAPLQTASTSLCMLMQALATLLYAWMICSITKCLPSPFCTIAQMWAAFLHAYANVYRGSGATFEMEQVTCTIIKHLHFPSAWCKSAHRGMRSILQWCKWHGYASLQRGRMGWLCPGLHALGGRSGQGCCFWVQKRIDLGRPEHL